MSLTYRPTRPGDLKSCFAMLDDRQAYDDGDARAVPAFWEALLRTRAALSWVVEDRALAPDSRTLGFGMSVFVSDDFRREMETTLGAHVGRQLYVRWRSGRKMFLGREEIARRNTEDGLDLLVMAHGTTASRRDEAGMQVRSRMLEAFSECHDGYVLKEAAQEVFDPAERAEALALGWQVVRDLHDDATASRPARGGTSVLARLRRDDCHFPHPLWRSFHPPRPRFRFSDTEKEVLEAALLSGTDEEISRALAVSIWSIKKRWQRVYEKVERVIPDLFDADVAGADPPGGQRRRHLLDYVRQCPEEIRPSLESRRAKQVRRGA